MLFRLEKERRVKENNPAENILNDVQNRLVNLLDFAPLDIRNTNKETKIPD